MSFEDELKAKQRAQVINRRVNETLDGLDRSATPDELIRAINEAYTADDPNKGELTYELDEDPKHAN